VKRFQQTDEWNSPDEKPPRLTPAKCLRNPYANRQFRGNCATPLPQSGRLSHSIYALEIEAGCRLLAKLGKSIVPTQALETLMHHAELGLKELAEARKKLEKPKRGERAASALAPVPLINRRILPGIFMDLRHQHPHLTVSGKTVHSARQTDQLRDGELDFVISEEQRPHPDVEFIALFESQLQIIVPTTHRWMSQKRIPRDELYVEPFLLPERLSPIGKLI
jgi:LysR family transcriptional regulator, cyn operon transcriptional activator